MAKILVVDDEPNIREVVGLYLRREGYDVLSAADGEEGLELYHQGRPDLVVLDLILPKLDGLEVCRRMQAQRRVPLIMLTARGEEADRVLGMGAAADDYVVKPFRLRELMARVSALLRETEARTNQADGGTLAFDGMRLDPVTREVVIRGTTATLTAREFDLLYHLASSPGRTFTRDELMEAVWDHQFAAEPTAVTMSVRRLREKIEEDPGHPRHLLTIWGVGTGWGSGGAYVGPALVLVALVLVLGACGPAGGGDQAETVTVIKTVPADEGSGRAEELGPELTLGDTFTTSGAGNEVTVLSYESPLTPAASSRPDPGFEFSAVEIEGCASRDPDNYRMLVGPASFSLQMPDGARVQPETGGDVARVTERALVTISGLR